ncbi:MAG: DUF262 domain-containing protein [Pseudonocardiales bacterium]|nr:DUF262 domain-containing protein [Pseudonocardiales bacterium]MBV9032453.1 DUF262 domain-containing protein [Pseudonocardiales bacterium]
MSSGLETRATTLDLDDLVGLAWSGRIRVPHFQRDFRWTRQDVIRLLDSVVKRYPVGGLLLWRRPAPAQRLTLGALRIDAPQVDQALWVVDGQQRVTSLANALHPDGARDPRFDLGCDVRDDRIVSRPGTDDPYVIPLPTLFDLAKVLDWFATHPEVGDYRNRAFELAKHLRQFAIPAYQVVQDDTRVLRDIFDRMNSYGKRLSRAEIFSALNAGDESDAEHTLSIDQIADHVEDESGFGRVDADTVLRAILARRGPDVHREIRLEFDDDNRRGDLEFRNEDRDSAFAAGEEALVRAVRFLQSIGVPHVTLLAYRYLLVVLTRVFAHHPDPDPANLRLLGRWYWRAAVLGPEIFKGSATGAVRILCTRVDPADLSGSIRDLLGALDERQVKVDERQVKVDERQVKIPELRRFRTNEASAKITLCSWWELGPRSPDTGVQFELSQLTEALIDRATAADAVAVFVARRFVPEPYRLWASNRALVPVLIEPANGVSGAFLQRPFDVAEDIWAQVLQSHSISPESERHLAAGDTVAFLESRRMDLQRVLGSFLARKCEWGFENTPPLHELLIEDLDGAGDDDAA